jgi:hypothetical protein
MRSENLTTVKGGLNRLRTKGAALKDSLYQLLNGYVTMERTIKVRPGTLLTDTLTAGTKGLVHFDGGFHVFASATVSVPSGYTLHLLISPDDASLAVSKIHFAEPFLGVLYISAEFTDGGIYHYWLEAADAWAASTAYTLNGSVVPASPNGLIYKARRLTEANPVWTAGTPRSVSDVVEPTTENNFKYTVSQVIGDTPRSGDLEPVWPTRLGEIIVEDLDGDQTEPPVVAYVPPPQIPDGAGYTADERYQRELSNLDEGDD